MTCHYVLGNLTVPARIGRGGLTPEQDAYELQRQRDDELYVASLQLSRPMLSQILEWEGGGRREGEGGREPNPCPIP